ncbi:MAG: protein kinase [Chloroflexota bacterium]
MALQSGELIRNRYRIMHQLSDSAYRAMDMSLRQPCLVKEFSGTTSERVSQLAHVQHPNLPRVIDLVRQGDQSLLVMDFISGTNLSEYLYQVEQGVPAEQAQAWLEQLVDTLTYLHQQEPPIAHGDVSIDHIVIRPDGSVALTNFSSYSRNPAEDLVNLGHVLGFLATGELPPVSKEQMIALLDGRSELLAQRALALLNGTIDTVQNALGPLDPQLPDKSEASTIGLEDMAAVDEDISTVVLGDAKRDDSEPAVPASDSAPPVMPWDKPAGEASPATEVWGSRPDSSELKSEPAPPEPDNVQKTEVLTPLTASLESTASSTPTSPPVTQVSPSAQTPEEKQPSSFNWLWIIVGIMAGVVLLCAACIGFIYWNWDELVEATPAPQTSFVNDDEADVNPTEVSIEAIVAEDDSKPPTVTPLPTATEAPQLSESTDESEAGEETEEPQFNLPEPEEDETQAEASESNPLDDPDIGSEVVRSETYGYEVTLPPGFIVIEEVDGTLTAESPDGEQGIFMAVFPNQGGLTVDLLMEQAIESIESEGGNILSEPSEKTTNRDKESAFVLVEIPDDLNEGELYPGVVYVVGNEISTAVLIGASDEDNYVLFVNDVLEVTFSLELFEPQ